ncbi:phospholipid-binding protein [Leptolyngbya cf. ectocarpi LEGE 11479]|uniref:Phospholipid-binding protein n=1 Tax=Leptolyngbya cf. ectocarpi LEGE 11479 TaxID=1828722 RepID=A0A928X123_LEPEC|nr:phospholipid-binding protein [Leptolyngbya ectocarpi]MBE9065431.1 phospholipid-binding protein [Leptolyngbya cf. ectocarpi LEGE 11479]
MGFLKRIFKQDKPAGASTKAGRRPGAKKSAPKAAAAPTAAAPANAPAAEDDIPLCKIGLTGEFDESGLAKRVTLAFDEDSQLDDVETLWVAQLSSKVVLKGKVPSQAILDKMVAVANDVEGATAVDTSQVEIG